MKRLLLMVAIVPLLAAARTQEPKATDANPSFRAEFLVNLAEVEGKLIQLAEAVPAEKYTWRPAPGVRSVSEVLTHVAGSNYFLLTFVGAPPPPGIPADIETITEKREVVAELRKSFAHLRAAANTIEESGLEKPVKMFGNNTTRRGVYMTILNHLHEHLGQSIAYARMNGVTPPWSR
ncbi:MAG TPA: DinB family protein [Thermoanaerobaculia bacterium]|nr:DinB family protein [Thermoanaerobaculia bacterium]